MLCSKCKLNPVRDLAVLLAVSNQCLEISCMRMKLHDEGRAGEVGEDEVGEDEVGEDEVGEEEVGEDEVGEDEVGEDEVGEVGSLDEVGEERVGEDEAVEVSCSHIIVLGPMKTGTNVLVECLAANVENAIIGQQVWPASNHVCICNAPILCLVEASYCTGSQPVMLLYST